MLILPCCSYGLYACTTEGCQTRPLYQSNQHSLRSVMLTAMRRNSLREQRSHPPSLKLLRFNTSRTRKRRVEKGPVELILEKRLLVRRRSWLYVRRSLLCCRANDMQRAVYSKSTTRPLCTGFRVAASGPTPACIPLPPPERQLWISISGEPGAVVSQPSRGLVIPSWYSVSSRTRRALAISRQPLQFVQLRRRLKYFVVSLPYGTARRLNVSNEGCSEP